MSSCSRISLTVERTLARNSSGDRSAAVGAISASTLAWTTALDCDHASSDDEVRSALRRLGVSVPIVAVGRGAAGGTLALLGRGIPSVCGRQLL